MKNVTILLQGKILQDSIDFLIKNYPTANVVVSTWIGSDTDFSKLPSSYTLIQTKLPENGGDQNINYQILSTLNGLRFVDTDYVIKIRGDEYYSNLEYITNQIIMNPTKIHSSPIFFRHWSFMKYHISDHIIAGTKKNLQLMFEETKFNIENELVYHMVNGKPHRFWEPEINLTRSYLMVKEPKRWDKVDGRKLMVDNFEILDIQKLHPYKIVANIFKAEWTDGFVPERNFSISDVRRLYLTKEEAYDTNITPREH
jgi:hypothetical protein